MSQQHSALIEPGGSAARPAAAWLILGVAALGASTLFALLLIVSRTPYLGWLLPGHDFFRTALVLHVNLSALIWFLSCAGMLWSLLPGPRIASAMAAAFGLAAAGALAVAASPLAGGGVALLNNYLPVLDHPVFLGGLLAFGAGVVFAALRTLLGLRLSRLAQGPAAALYGAAGALLAALASLVWSYLTLPQLPAGAYYESLFWGLGHTLQFSFTFMMLAAWLWLARGAGMAMPSRPRWVAALVLLGLLPLIAVPVIHLRHAVASAEFRQAFTDLMRFGTWPVVAPIALLLLAGLRRAWPFSAQQRPLLAALGLSMVMFAVGLGVGASIRQDNAMVPAHYHGVIGAVTVALMGLALHLLPQMGFARPAPRYALWQPLCYGGGTLLMIAGLAWSGGRGVARKVPGSLQVLDGGQEIAGMALMGLGGLVAIVGSLMFVLIVYRAMRPRREAEGAVSAGRAPGGRGARAARALDRRPFALALSIGLIVALGAVVAVLPGSGVRQSLPAAPIRVDPKADPGGHARQARRAEMDQRFKQAVVMLHAKQYEHAAAALHRVLELDPTLVEAHVNMGYAMIGLERYKVAFDFFESATQLRPMQANAYYGMAVAMEALKDVPGAIGAMSTFVHLAPANDPYQRKAQGALWEWEAELARMRGATPKGDQAADGSAAATASTAR